MFNSEIEAQGIEAAVDRMLSRGYRTMDIAQSGSRIVRGSEFAENIRAEMRDSLVHTEHYGWGV